MKRNKFIKHLSENNCELHRNGGKHDIFINNVNKQKTTIPRHPDIDERLCAGIC